jgi:hypothetical protein
MFIKKGFIDKVKIWNWVKNYEDLLVNERWNDKEVNCGRKSLWFGIGVELGFKSRVFEGYKIDSGLKNKCDELWGGKDWNSLLLYKYEVGSELKNHIDRDIFDNKVVVINISEDDLFGGNVEFYYDGSLFILSNGEVVEFDCKKYHGVKKVKNERWSLSIRKVLV